MSRSLATACALVLLVAACGDDSSSTNGTQGGATSGSSPTTAAGPGAGGADASAAATTTTSALATSGTGGAAPLPPLEPFAAAPNGFALDADHVYLTYGQGLGVGEGDVLRKHKETLEEEVLFVGTSCASVAVGGDQVYVGCLKDTGELLVRNLLRAPKAGGAPTELHAREDAINDWYLAADAERVFFVDFPDILSVAAGATEVTVLSSPGETPERGLVVDASSLFLHVSGDLYALPLAGGELAELSASPPGKGFGLAQTSTELFFLFEETSLMRAPKAGGANAPVANAVDHAPSSGFAVDEAYLYHFRGNDLFRVPLAGGEAEPLATLGDSQYLFPESLAVDDTHVYVLYSDLGSAGLGRTAKVPAGG